MNEKFLHYIWQQKLHTAHDFKTADGEIIEVIDPGKLNTDAGPDFFNAKLKIGDTLWAGNVEFHINASDWAKHHHNTDNVYDSVILHVVNNIDAAVFRSAQGQFFTEIQSGQSDAQGFHVDNPFD